MFKTIITVAVLATASAASATSYDVVSTFGVAGSPFSFGTDQAASFTALPDYMANNCVGTRGLACFDTPSGDYTFPIVGKNIGRADPLHFYTNVLPSDMLFLQANPGASTTVRFTAPQTATYHLVGSFTRIDTSNGAGDGVYTGLSAPSFGGGGLLGSNYLDTDMYNITRDFTAGEVADFSLYAGGNTYNDGTGFRLTVASVPEPATWGMMFVGFGAMGGAMRRRRKGAVSFS